MVFGTSEIAPVHADELKVEFVASRPVIDEIALDTSRVAATEENVVYSSDVTVGRNAPAELILDLSQCFFSAIHRGSSPNSFFSSFLSFLLLISREVKLVKTQMKQGMAYHAVTVGSSVLKNSSAIQPMASSSTRRPNRPKHPKMPILACHSGR